jgi:hypothetical protein
MSAVIGSDISQLAPCSVLCRLTNYSRQMRKRGTDCGGALGRLNGSIASEPSRSMADASSCRVSASHRYRARSQAIENQSALVQRVQSAIRTCEYRPDLWRAKRNQVVGRLRRRRELDTRNCRNKTANPSHGVMPKRHQCTYLCCPRGHFSTCAFRLYLEWA